MHLTQPPPDILPAGALLQGKPLSVSPCLLRKSSRKDGSQVSEFFLLVPIQTTTLFELMPLDFAQLSLSTTWHIGAKVKHTAHLQTDNPKAHKKLRKCTFAVHGCTCKKKKKTARSKTALKRQRQIARRRARNLEWKPNCVKPFASSAKKPILLSCPSFCGLRTL